MNIKLVLIPLTVNTNGTGLLEFDFCRTGAAIGFRPIFLGIIGFGWVTTGLLLLLSSAAVWAGLLKAGQKSYQAEVESMKANAMKQPAITVTREMLDPLPEPVKRYLMYAGVVGKPIVRTVSLKQKGRIRKDARDEWMPLEAEQYYSTVQPGFIWVGWVKKFRTLPIMRALDSYLKGKGRMLLKLGGIKTVKDAGGPQMDQGAMLRYLNEMMWFPTAYLGSNVSFTPINHSSAGVTLTDSGKQVSGVLTFDKLGRLTNFIAERYYDVTGEMNTWCTPITEYGNFNGLNLPFKGKGVWKTKHGYFAYIDLEVTQIKYDD